MSRPSSRRLLLLLVGPLAFYSPAADSTAAKTCGACHPKQAQSQPKTAMGIGIQLPPDQTVLAAHPKLTFEKDGYLYTVQRQDGVSSYTVSDGVDTLTLPVRYAFGTHMQTFVLEHDGRLYESQVSFYPNVGGLDITLGDEHRQPHNLVEAMGRETLNPEITACFECHGRGGVREGKLTLDTLQPGVHCEHCHAGAGAHFEALSHGKPAPLPKKLGRIGAEEMSTLCGQCHRTWDNIVRLRQFGKSNVRFQPYRIANSKCFLGNDRRIGCTACHDPHADLVRDASFYDSACLACHTEQLHKISISQAAAPKFCPVAKDKCVTCHMPKVTIPGSPARFTDHQIRIVRADEPYPN